VSTVDTFGNPFKIRYMDAGVKILESFAHAAIRMVAACDAARYLGAALAHSALGVPFMSETVATC
jgi:hypothetical protein